MGVAGMLCMIHICSSSFSLCFSLLCILRLFIIFLHVHSFDTWYVEIAHPLAVFMTPNNLYKSRLQSRFVRFTDALSLILSLVAVSLIVHIGHCALSAGASPVFTPVCMFILTRQ